MDTPKASCPTKFTPHNEICKFAQVTQIFPEKKIHDTHNGEKIQLLFQTKTQKMSCLLIVQVEEFLEYLLRSRREREKKSKFSLRGVCNIP